MRPNRFLLIIFTLLHVYECSFSQEIITNSGAKAAGLGYCAVTFSNHLSPINNVAGIANVKDITLSASAKKLYNIKGLNSINLNLIYPTDHFSLAVSVAGRGDQFLNIQRLGVGIANKIGFVQIGLQVNYLQYSAHELGAKGAFVLDFGGIAELGEKIKFGAYIFNLTQSRLYSTPVEPLPVDMKVGLAYQPLAKLKLLFEVEKEMDFDPLKKAGLEYQALKGLFVRTGVTFDPVKNYFGLGFYRKRLMVDYAFNNHNRLGLSHHISLGYKLSKNE